MFTKYYILSGFRTKIKRGRDSHLLFVVAIIEVIIIISIRRQVFVPIAILPKENHPFPQKPKSAFLL